MFDTSGYTGAPGVNGTSFSAPIVAGAVALAKQRNPGATPAQLKSLVVNTANPAIGDYNASGARISASVTAIGAGKLNANDAIRSTIAVSPATLSFGEVSQGTLAPQQTLAVTNLGTQIAGLTLSIAQTTPDGVGSLALSTNSLTINPGQSATVTVRLNGNVPQPGSYEGALRITGGTTDIRVPYLYLVGDRQPYSIVPLRNFDFVGVANAELGRLVFKVTDRFGVPVANVPVRVRPANLVGDATETTDNLGIADARVFLANTLGEQSFTADAGTTNPLSTTFVGRAILRPAIQAGGVVNAGSGRAGAWRQVPTFRFTERGLRRQHAFPPRRACRCRLRESASASMCRRAG